MGKDILHVSTSSLGKAQEKRPDVGFCGGFLWLFLHLFPCKETSDCDLRSGSVV